MKKIAEKVSSTIRENALNGAKFWGRFDASKIRNHAKDVSEIVSKSVVYDANDMKIRWDSSKEKLSENKGSVREWANKYAVELDASKIRNRAKDVSEIVSKSVNCAANDMKEKLSKTKESAQIRAEESKNYVTEKLHNFKFRSQAKKIPEIISKSVDDTKVWWSFSKDKLFESKESARKSAESSEYDATVGKHAIAIVSKPNDSVERSQKENFRASIFQGSWRIIVLAMYRNARKYDVRTAGRKSNIVNIFDKSKISSLGNPKWWVRFDRPHGNVPFYHININPKLTGVPDPHIPISAGTATAAERMGEAAEAANDVAPYLTAALVAYEGYKLGTHTKKDYENGTTRKSITKIATLVGTYTSAYLGSFAGAICGTKLLPGLGTIFGGLVGGGVGAVYGRHSSVAAIEKVLDRLEWETAEKEQDSDKFLDEDLKKK